MKFLADECCDASLVEKLRSVGYDVLYVKDDAPGVTDKQVLAMSLSENRALITEDKDFGELVYQQKKEAVGIILLRFLPTEKEVKWRRLKGVIQRDDITIIDNFIVVDTEKFRIRPLL